MNPLIQNSLYTVNKKQYKEISNCVITFNSLYNKNNIIRDDIFNIIENYVTKNGMSFELLRFPINDKELCAFTFVRENIIFVMINSAICLSKQIFAGAHELYHIYCYFNKRESSLLQTGEIYDFKDIEDAKDIEDINANAFAAMLLAPKDRLQEQLDIYDLNYYNINTILKIMDIFALPYKATVIRLYEENKIDIKIADKLLAIPIDEINKQIKLTGKSARWQETPNKLIKFGNLDEIMYELDKKELINKERYKSDKKRLSEITKLFLIF